MLLKEIEKNIKKMADNALRTIAIAYKDISKDEPFEAKDQLGVYDIEQKGLILVAILGIADAIRPEVPKAIQ